MNSKSIVIIYNATHHVLLFKSELIKSIRENGYRIVVLASVDNYTEKLKEIVDEFHEIKLDSSGVNPIKDTYLIFQIYSICKSIKPTAILNFTIKPVIYGTLASRVLGGVPVINTITGLGTAFISSGFANKVAKFLYKFTFKYSHLVFFQNPDDQQFFRKLKIITKNNTKLISGSGVDLVKFKPVENNKRDDIKILFIGRIIADKGIYELIESAQIIKKEYSNVSFILMGMLGVKNNTSISENEVDKWINDGVIEFIPFQDDIRRFLGDSDVVVLPSYREGTPKTLIEAASMAKPLIATDVPGCREVVKHEVNGFLCEVKNPVSLAAAIKRYIELDDSSKIEMGEKSRELAEEKFDIIKVNNCYINEINKIIDKNGKR
jgi:glycosyltransferase involved in cell wall biosynthesis|tara:strand:- start:2361 stop:3494 length:1134 start_codon:yes stop_codon:yes gene_type:complete